MRIYDVDKIGHAISTLLGTDIDAKEWVANLNNIVLENEYGDLALFEHAFIGKPVYSGHYFFKSRGKQAIASAKGFLDELFNTCYNIHVVMGLVPLDNKAARWISRRLGFTSHGLDEIHGTEYEMFILTRKEFNGG